MSKKARKSEFVGGSSYSYPIGGGGGDKARLKYEILLQDYHELRRESEAKKKKLQKINQKKLQLLNEVRFLRKRYEKLTKNPPQQSQCVVLKKQALRVNPNSEDLYDTKSIEAPSTSRVSYLDLNQANEEETEVRVMKTEDLKGQNCKKDEKERMFVCRDFGTGTGTNRAGKGKITWKDQVVLQV
ncbi:hypothetical protein LUZ60_002914 [Juncus effusus]|nr:hypothetical protein LUZ60_002914 [Juncus effusus]